MNSTSVKHEESNYQKHPSCFKPILLAKPLQEWMNIVKVTSGIFRDLHPPSIPMRVNVPEKISCGMLQLAI